MAGALVEMVTNKLGTILKEDLTLRGDASQELDILSSEFQAIQAVLHDAERRQISDESVRLWLAKLKDVAYDMDDVLNDWLLLASSARTRDGNDGGSCSESKVWTVVDSLVSSVGLGDWARLGWESWKDEGAEGSGLRKKARTFYSNVVSWKDVAQRVKGIRLRLDQIAREKNEFGFRENYCLLQGSRSAMDDSETSSLVDELKIIGREVDKGRIISRVIGSGTSQAVGGVDVICITGVGGMGKTTLGRLISQDERVKQHFQKVLWVCVSDAFDVKRIMKAIIQDCGYYWGSSSGLPSELNPLQRMLRETLEGKLFLLILDDIWNEDEEKWEKLRLPLQSGARGSKILITTRSNKVASIMNATYVRELKGLSEEDSWSLFRGKAFARRKALENQIELEKIGKEIVKKCCGVPLSVKVMGSAMQSKARIEDWRNISESEIWALPEVKEDILSALLLSYFNLPLQLRRCFAYCSIFPKDSYIEKEKLVKMWSAQGFIQSQGRREIEDIGGEYFDELAARSMFQDLEKFSDGNVRCKMHDLLRNLAGFIVKDESSIFGIETSDPSSRKVRHASVMATRHGTSRFPPPMAEKLRTLLIFGEIGVPDSLFSGAKFLRVLDLGNQGIQIEHLPECVGELKHLRYLGLSGSSIKELPESFCRLCNLETLNLNSCSYLERLPRGMSRMQSLRHLEIKETASLTYLPKRLGRLTSLRTLPRFILGGEEGCTIGELKQLNSLRGRLCIENLGKVSSGEEAKEAVLWKKSCLCELYLTSSPHERGTVNDSVLDGLQPPHENLRVLKILNYDGLKFPTWMEDLPFCNLVDVKLENCRKCKQLPGLGTLPALKRLTLLEIGVGRVNSEFYYGMNRSDGGRPSVGVAFPRLEYLRLQSMLELEEWEFPTKTLEGTSNGEEIMPSLKHLTIFDCPKLKALPQCLPGILTLEYFKVRGLPKLRSLPVGLGQLKALKQLKMLELDSLTALPDVFGELQELEHLIIIDLPNLRSLPDGRWQLKALKLLQLGNLPKLTSFPDGLGQLTELKRLELWNLPRLTSLPDGLGELKELKRLEIRSLENMTSLPEVFEELKALEYLTIRDCDTLASLPRGLQHLTTLHKLQVSECELLSKRCATLVGADWPKISHIPCIEIFPSPRLTWQEVTGRATFQRLCGVSHIPADPLDRPRVAGMQMDFTRSAGCYRKSGYSTFWEKPEVSASPRAYRGI